MNLYEEVRKYFCHFAWSEERGFACQSVSVFSLRTGFLAPMGRKWKPRPGVIAECFKLENIVIFNMRQFFKDTIWFAFAILDIQRCGVPGMQKPAGKMMFSTTALLLMWYC